MIALHRIAEAPDAALRLAADTVAAQAPSPRLPAPPVDADAAARMSLRRALDADPLVSGWVALDGERAVALLAASFELVDENHFGYTYLHPRHASTPLSWWAVAEGEDADAVLAPLLGVVADDARPHGIARLLVQTRPHDWIGASFWLRRGMWSDAVLAGRPIAQRRQSAHPEQLAQPERFANPEQLVHPEQLAQPERFARPERLAQREPPRHPRIAVRTARTDDEDALVRLAFEEYAHHAAHTRTGTIADQAEEPTRREIAAAFAEQADGRGAQFVADGPDGSPAGSLRAMILDVPDGAAGRRYLPGRYGYIGLTSVVPSARGTGIGTALTDAALAWFADRGLDYALLHYVHDNDLSRPFWTARGFAPLSVAFTGDVLR